MVELITRKRQLATYPAGTVTVVVRRNNNDCDAELAWWPHGVVRINGRSVGVARTLAEVAAIPEVMELMAINTDLLTALRAS